MLYQRVSQENTRSSTVNSKQWQNVANIQFCPPASTSMSFRNISCHFKQPLFPSYLLKSYRTYSGVFGMGEYASRTYHNSRRFGIWNTLLALMYKLTTSANSLISIFIRKLTEHPSSVEHGSTLKTWRGDWCKTAADLSRINCSIASLTKLRFVSDAINLFLEEASKPWTQNMS